MAILEHWPLRISIAWESVWATQSLPTDKLEDKISEIASVLPTA